jgi:methionyl-tRNA formyltransferase
MELAELGAELMVRTLADLEAFPCVAQPEDGVTYAAKIDKAETKLDFSLSAVAVERQIRAFNPAPGAWFAFEGERYRVLAADIIATHGAAGTIIDDQLTIACGVHAIRPTRIQRAGKPAMPTADLLRGKAIPAGTLLS